MPEYIWERRAREKRAREQEASDIALKLPSIGITDPQSINEVTSEYVKTGRLVIPEFQATSSPETRIDIGSKIETTSQGGVPTTIFPDTNVGFKPVKLGKSAATYNDQTGQISPVDLPGNTEFLRISPKPAKDTSAALHVINGYTGEEIQAIPIQGTTDQRQVVYPGKPGAGGRGGSAATPEQKVAIETMKNYLKRQADGTLAQGIANGDQWAIDLSEAAAWAQEKLNGQSETTTTPGQEAPAYKPWQEDVAPKPFKKPSLKPSKSSYDSPESVRDAYRSGKLSKEEARRLIETMQTGR